MSGAISAPTDFSTGNDTSLVLMFGILGRIDLPHIIGFHAQQQVKQLRVSRLNDSPLSADIPGGWTGTIALTRGGPAADNLAATLETMYWNKVRLPKGQIFQFIAEPDGSRSRFSYIDVSLNLTDAGNWRQEAQVDQTISFFAGRRVKL